MHFNSMLILSAILDDHRFYTLSSFDDVFSVNKCSNKMIGIKLLNNVKKNNLNNNIFFLDREKLGE